MAAERKLIAVQLPADERFLDAWDEVWADGHALLPLRPDLPAPARDRVLTSLRPHVLVDASGRRELDNPAPLDPRTDLVVATSGTTGPPKGVELSREALHAAARAGLDRLAAGDAPWLCTLPLDHLAGLQVVLRARLAGARLLLHERFDPHAVAADGRGAFVSLVPTMLRRLLDVRAEVAAFRAILLGGAAPPAGLVEEAENAGARVVTTYGMTETAGGCVYDGVPLEGAEVRVDGSGLIALTGPMLFHGYRLDAQRTRAALRDGWFHTADLGRIDADGRLTVIGRSDDVIVTGGENVSAGEAAKVLERHSAVAQAAVVGLPDPEWGARLIAVVVPRPGMTVTLDELRAHVRAVSPSHVAPRDLVVVDALPRTALGKLDQAELLALVRRGPGPAAH